MNARDLMIGFIIGFFVGPVYFKWIYPFLYHLPEMLAP